MKPTALSKQHLVAMLYLLMRDAAPTGEVVRVVRMLDTTDDSPTRYTSKELHDYAERLAGELLA